MIKEKFSILITDENREEVKRLAYENGMTSAIFNFSTYYHWDGRMWEVHCSETPIIDLKGFKSLIDKYKGLPEKWAVKFEGQKELIDWVTSRPDFNKDFDPIFLKQGHFVVNKHSKDKSYQFYSNKLGNIGYTEITFDQFKKWVLKEEGEIEGYICPMDLVNGKIPKGTVYIEYGNNKTLYVPDLPLDSVAYYSVPAEIVKTWEPVYKKAPVKSLIGDLVIEIEKGVLKICDQDVRIEQLEEVVNTYKSFNP